MIAVYISVLLNKYSKPLYEVSSALKSSQGRLDKTLCEQFSINPQEFSLECKRGSIGVSGLDLWERVLRLNAPDFVYTSIASELKINKDFVSYSPLVQNKIMRVIAEKLVEVHSFTNSDLISVIQSMARDAGRQYSSQLLAEVQKKGSFQAKLRNGDANEAWTSGFEDEEEFADESKINWKALKNVTGDDFKRVMSDIYKVTPLMVFQSQDPTVKKYSLFACFLNTFSQKKIDEINALIEPHLTIVLDNTSSNLGVRKYRKYDLLMEEIYPYIIGSLAKNNVYDFVKKVCRFLFFENNSQVTFFTREIDLTPSELNAWQGNFDFRKRFKREKDAENFTTFVLGLFALNRLYAWLVAANCSPLSIDSDIFLYDDPAAKFKSLDELVKCSKIYCQVRRQYYPTQGTGSVVDLEVISSKLDSFVQMRQAIDRTGCIDLLIHLVEGSGDQFTLLSIPDGNEEESAYYHKPFMEVIDRLVVGLNPLLVVNDDYDSKVTITMEAANTWKEDAEEKLNGWFMSPAIQEYTLDLLLDEVELHSPDLAVLLQDIYPDANFRLSYARVVYHIVDILECVLCEVENLSSAPASNYVSQFEIAHSCSRTTFFRALKGLDAKNIEDRYSTVFLGLLDGYRDEITFDPIENSAYVRFFSSHFLSQQLTKFKVSVGQALQALYTMVNATTEMFIDLVDTVMAPSIKGAKLLGIYSSLNCIKNETAFGGFVLLNNYKPDVDGYYTRAEGSYVVKTFNNKIGYLHSLGMYVFNDGTAIIWSDRYAN